MLVRWLALLKKDEIYFNALICAENFPSRIFIGRVLELKTFSLIQNLSTFWVSMIKKFRQGSLQ